MPKFRETLIEYEGVGEIVFKEVDSIKIKFKCRQLWDGSIEGDIELLENAYTLSFFDFERPVEIRGKTKDKEFMIFIKSVYITHWKIYSREKESGITDIKFVAREIEVIKREFSSDKPEVLTIFEITNFRSFETTLETNIGKLTFKNYRGWENIVKDIDTYKKACITARAYLVFKPEIRVKSIAHCLELSKKEINKVLTLTSFSQGIYQSWVCVSIYEKINGKYELIYLLHIAPKTKNMGFNPIIHFLDLTNYLLVTYPNYTDELEEKTGLRYAIEWYLESLAADTIESKYIMAFVCLELLVDRFESVEGDKILDDSIFKELVEKLKAEAKSFLKERGISKDKRSAIYANLRGLNRYPFIEQLKKFLAFYKIGYKDILEDLSRIVKIRNKLVHTGLVNVEMEDLFDTYRKLIVLIQRIILSILNYDGNSFINWLDNNLNIFNRNPLNEQINI